MAINGVYGDTAYQYTSSSTSSSSSSSSSNALGKDAFLSLLVTQLKYQDPMNPLDNNDMIAQLAQFSALEQTENLNTNFEKLRADSLSSNAVSLLGAEVHAKKIDDNNNTIEKTGIVNQVKFESGEAVFTIDNEEFGFSDLIDVKIPETVQL